MRYSIEIKPSALRALERLPKEAQLRIIKKIDSLAREHCRSE